MRIISIILLCFIVALSTYSCDGDKITPPEEKQTVDFKNLQNKDDVLFNLELAYNERRLDEYDKLLDENFIFVLSEADYNSGEVDVQQWDRDREVSVNAQILDPNLPGDKRVISIDLSLNYPAGKWAEQPENQEHPGESWYTKTVDYDLVVKTADDWEHRALGLQARFTIRKDDSTGRWQIVLWADDVGTLQALSRDGTTTEETTWGGIKAQYR